jgi:ABC-type antimicrobial peptide transport system permease subunit
MAEGRDTRLTLLGIRFRPPDGLGGPSTIVAGRLPRRPGEAALDQSAAHLLHVRLNDTLVINGTRELIVAITAGTNLLASQFVFEGTDSSTEALLPVASFGLIQLRAHADREQVRLAIMRRFPDVQVMTPGMFLANNLREVGTGFRPMLLLISLLGITSSALLVAFLVESLVEGRRNELAVLLAIGIPPPAIVAGLSLHVAKLLACGIVAGAIAAHALAAIIDFVAPVIPLSYTVKDLFIVAAILGASGFVASLVPIARLRHIDPLEAFRS